MNLKTKKLKCFNTFIFLNRKTASKFEIFFIVDLEIKKKTLIKLINNISFLFFHASYKT